MGNCDDVEVVDAGEVVGGARVQRQIVGEGHGGGVMERQRVEVGLGLLDVGLARLPLETRRCSDQRFREERPSRRRAAARERPMSGGLRALVP